MSRLFHVDAFTAEAFRGNPAAVVLLDAEPPADWMQAVAAELGLSETAFTWPGGPARTLRWFTPAVEVPLCGHATLATAHVLYADGIADPGEELAFATRSGTLRAVREPGGIRLDFPALAATPARPGPAVLALAGGAVKDAAVVDDLAGDRALLLELDGEDAVRAYRADDAALLATGFGGLVLTARADARGGADIVSRCFFPAAGLSEDPVTGAAHCALAPYWAAKLGRTELVGRQASARGGLVGMRLDGDRVHLIGQAVTVSAGTLLV